MRTPIAAAACAGALVVLVRGAATRGQAEPAPDRAAPAAADPAVDAEVSRRLGDIERCRRQAQPDLRVERGRIDVEWSTDDKGKMRQVRTTQDTLGSLVLRDCIEA